MRLFCEFLIAAAFHAKAKMSIPSHSKRPPLITNNRGETNSSTGAADVMLIFGKGIDPLDIKQIRPILQDLNVSSLILGDGVRNVRSKPMRMALHDKLAADGQVVIYSHGRNNPDQHAFELSDFSKGYGHVPTLNLIRWGHELQDTDNINLKPAEKQRSGNRIVHLIACHVGQVVEQIMPGSPEWKAGYTLIYSDENETSLREVASSLETALTYFDWCKQQGKPLDPLKLFLLAAKRQSQSLTLLGGKLKAPLVSREPATLEELELDQARKRITGGNLKDLRRLLAAEQELTPAENALLPDPANQLIEMLFKFLERAENASLEKALSAHPDLINTCNDDGLNLLIKASAEENIACVKILIRLGADVNIFDHEGDTALHVAIERGNSELVALLLKAGAWTTSQNAKRQNSLELAQALDKKNIVTLISKHLRKL